MKKKYIITGVVEFSMQTKGKLIRFENGAVSGYKAIEDSAVGLYQTIENKFVETFLDGNNTKKQK
jgi:hypothetical protein